MSTNSFQRSGAYLRERETLKRVRLNHIRLPWTQAVREPFSGPPRKVSKMSWARFHKSLARFDVNISIQFVKIASESISEKFTPYQRIWNVSPTPYGLTIFNKTFHDSWLRCVAQRWQKKICQMPARARTDSVPPEKISEGVTPDKSFGTRFAQTHHTKSI
jgi:hypothetical protein